jgi:hypothetical protein
MLAVELNFRFSAALTDAERHDLEVSLRSFLDKNGAPPDTLVCRQGSTAIVVQYLIQQLDALIHPTIVVVGTALACYVYKKIGAKTRTQRGAPSTKPKLPATNRPVSEPINIFQTTDEQLKKAVALSLGMDTDLPLIEKVARESEAVELTRTIYRLDPSTQTIEKAEVKYIYTRETTTDIPEYFKGIIESQGHLKSDETSV